MADSNPRKKAAAAGSRRKRRGPAFLKRHPALVRWTLIAVTFLVASGTGFAFASWALVCRGGACPAAEALEGYTPRQTSKLYAADGRFLAELGLERRTLVTIDDIPPIVRDAFVITEDRRFYSHGGVDPIGLAGAVKDRLVGRDAQLRGASTITQQLARNIFPERISRDRSPVRKLKEMKVAREIERRYPKSRILELYLNQISLGNGAHGVETAAQRYFGKSVRDLNLAEAATLAALPKAPERYNPRRYPDRAIQRRNTVIELMRQEGLVSDEEASLAKAYPMQLARRTEAGDLAPYFVEWVRQQLDDQFGRQLYEQGLKVYTTLDVDAQLAAERALERQLKAIEAGTLGPYRHITYEQYTAREASGDDAGANSPYLQGAFIALDPRTGGVKALVGGRDFDDSKFNRATQAMRQPGSTFKPIVYATAIHRGLPPSYTAEDAPISVPQDGGRDWTPQNFDGKFMGPIPMRRALYLSRNLAAIDVGREVGEQSVIDMARRFGIRSPMQPYPSIHLGAADVLPIEMIGAYSVFASLGYRTQPHAILRVENAKGEVLWQHRATSTPVLSAEEAWLMVDMMKDVVQRGTAHGSTWGAGFRVPAAGKTGTTNDGADVWFIGYTADMVAGVWMGFDQPKKIKANAQGGSLAAPAWTAFMKEIYQRRDAPPDWPRPSSLVAREVDGASGLLAGPFCSGDGVYTEWFIPGTEPYEECGWGTPMDGWGLPVDSAAGATPGTPPGTPRPRRDSVFNPFRLPPPPTPPDGADRR